MVASWRDEELLALFVTRRRELVNYARAIVGDRAAAEDVVQDAYFRLERAGAVKMDDRLDEPVGYIFRIVRNLAIDGRRKMVRESNHVGIDENSMTDAVPEDRPDPEAQAIARSEIRLLEQILAELPARSRIALEMHRFGGCKFSEIAARLDISVGTAHALVTDAIEHCKTRLARER